MWAMPFGAQPRPVSDSVLSGANHMSCPKAPLQTLGQGSGLGGVSPALHLEGEPEPDQHEGLKDPAGDPAGQRWGLMPQGTLAGPPLAPE